MNDLNMRLGDSSVKTVFDKSTLVFQPTRFDLKKWAEDNQ